MFACASQRFITAGMRRYLCPVHTPLRTLALLFLRLGATAFGGPAAHVAIMEDEVVRRRAWMSREEFFDLVGASQLIPGPNCTQLATVAQALWGFGRTALNSAVTLAVAVVSGVALTVSLGKLLLVFLKAGGLLFGSGYVLVAFLRTDLVLRLGWLTETQLIDAIAVGQFTPGPVFTTATFEGYLLAGNVGALVALMHWRVNSAGLVVGGALVGWVAA